MAPNTKTSLGRAKTGLKVQMKLSVDYHKCTYKGLIWSIIKVIWLSKAIKVNNRRAI